MTQVKVLVGTRKGAWIYTADPERRHWQISEPILPGWSIYHMSADLRGSPPRLLAAANHWAWGPSVARSDDLGKTWEQRSPGLGFPADMGLTVANTWHVVPGHASQPGVIYAGTEPAGLFRSEDGGDSWRPVESLNRHEFRQFWAPPAATRTPAFTQSKSTHGTRRACTFRSVQVAPSTRKTTLRRGSSEIMP